MQKKAPALLLLLPVLLLIVNIVLGGLIVLSLNKSSSPTQTSDKPPETSNTNSNPKDESKNAPPTNTSGNGAETDAFNKAMNAIPQRGFPDNTCSTHLVIESGGNKYALKGEEKFLITDAQATWIQGNCPEVKTLNF